MGIIKYRRLPSRYSNEEDWESNLNDFLQRLLQDASSGEPILIEVKTPSTTPSVLRYRVNDNSLANSLVVLWIFRFSCNNAPSLDDAVDDVEDWMVHGREDRNILCQDRIGSIDKTQSYFLGFRRVDEASAVMCRKSRYPDTFALSSNALPQSSTARRRDSQIWYSTMILIILMATTIIMTAIFVAQPVPRKLELCPAIQTIHAKFTKTAEQPTASEPTSTVMPSNTHGHIQYPTPLENEGPRHQNNLLSSNISAFRTRHNITSEFTLRLDDQALIPTALVDEYESNVQQWFATNFPVLATVRDSGDYLEPSYLDFEGEGRERILLHERYHIAHCTTAFRRYLRALQKQQHICPRDLDLGHLDHCTGQLERFAYRPRESWELVERQGNLHEDTVDRLMGKNEEFDPYGVQVMLVWHTDVCY